MNIPRTFVLCMLLAWPGMLQAQHMVVEPAPDQKRFVMSKLPSKDPSFKKKAEYVSLARNALAKKYGDGVHPFKWDALMVTLRTYKDLPEKDKYFISVLLDRNDFAINEAYNARMNIASDRGLIEVVIRKDLKVIYIHARKRKWVPH